MLPWHLHIDQFPSESPEQILLRWLRAVDRRDWLQARRMTSHFNARRVSSGNMGHLRSIWKDVRIEDISDIVRIDIPSEDPDQPGCTLCEVRFTARIGVRDDNGRWVSLSPAPMRMRLLRHDPQGVLQLHDTDDSEWRVVYYSLAPHTLDTSDDEATTTTADTVETSDEVRP